MPALQYPPLTIPPVQGQPGLCSGPWQRFFTDFWKTKGAAVKTITSTGTVHNLVIGPYSVIRCNNASLLTLTGLKGDNVDGQQVTLISIGAGHIEFVHQSGGSTTANRLVNFATSGNTPLAAGVGHATYMYDSTSARWRLSEHDQGTWITPTFAASDYIGAGEMTWTVEAGDVNTFAYFLQGRHLHVTVNLQGTSVGGTLDLTLQIKNTAFGGFTTTKTVKVPCIVYNASLTVGQSGTLFIGSNDTKIYVFNTVSALTNWAAATDTTNVHGQVPFEVN